jgi:peptidoglycan-associated lipoprotein
MMRSFRMCAVIFLVSGAMLTTACGKKKVETPAPAPAPPPPPPPTAPPAPPAPAPPPAAPAPAAPTEDELFAKMSLDDLNAKGVLADVFFALDSIELGSDARSVLQKNTDYLKRRASTKVLVEGHADARGTNEYNLALGERRAGAARDYVVSLGIPVDRITIVSKGEEQPVCREDNEACWAKNRRGHFIFTAK